MAINLGGLHDIESAAIAPPDTWLLDTIALSENPLPRDYPAHLHTIVRANWGYGSTGTLPKPDGYAQYAARLSAYVRGSRNCRRWIIGNEPNLSREWPDNQPIFPWYYAACYKMARAAIRGIPGHEQDEVLIAAPGPWNAELKYPGNAEGDWIKYFEDVLNTCYGELDGISIHSYTHGYSVPLVTSSARMQPPFQSRHYEFRAYRDYLEAMPDAVAHLPVYLTEANGNGPWQAVGLMPAMLNEIDNWNKSARIKIHCVIFYRYPRYDEYAIEGKTDVLAEYKQAIQAGYSSPSGSKNTAMPQTTLLPHVSNQAAPELQPRDWDARLTQRGVTVETPQLQPGQPYWRVKRARWFSESEAGGRHHIYVEAPAGTAFRVTWPSGEKVESVKNGAGFDAGNFAMSPSRNEFSVSMAGTPSEIVRGIGMGAETPGGFNAGIHTSTLVTFELATVPQAQAPTPPPAVSDPPTPDAPPPAQVPTLTHPIADASKRIITQHFGNGHTGIDYAVPTGTPIAAADAGTVLESQVDPAGYGEYVKLRHRWGESLYAHFKTRKVEVGEVINAGQVVGLSGSTGNSTGPHLHFAIRIFPYNRADGKDGFSDPSPYLPTGSAPAPQPTGVLSAIKAAAQEFGIEWQLLASLAWAESSFNARAESKAGAKGLMQLMPATWQEWSAQVFAGNDPFNAEQNARVGAAYLRWLSRQFQGDTYRALLAYNFGIGNVLAGIKPPEGTIAYVERVLMGRDLLKAVGA